MLEYIQCIYCVLIYRLLRIVDVYWYKAVISLGDMIGCHGDDWMEEEPANNKNLSVDFKRKVVEETS